MLSHGMLDALLKCAHEAAEKAGNYSLKYFGKPFMVKKKGAIDLVTEVDLQCEEIIRDTLLSKYPDYAFYGEESARESDKKEEFLWVVDPIDGTTNFAHGYPLYCVSIGLRYRGQSVLGLIYEPLKKTFYYAHSKSKAYKNKKAIRVSKANTLIDSLIITGFYYDLFEVEGVDTIAPFTRVLHAARGVRRDGSAAMNLCYTAEGVVEAFFEHSLQAWDVTAGMVILDRAGGKATTVEGAPYDVFSRGYLVASNGKVHKELLAKVKG